VSKCAATGPRPLANKPIKQICRELRVSRKTVRKVVRSGATEFTYERSVQPQPKIGPWRDELDRMLAENARKPIGWCRGVGGNSRAA
jgi:hypothetical protein